jgi:hypothetical protein
LVVLLLLLLFGLTGAILIAYLGITTIQFSYAIINNQPSQTRTLMVKVHTSKSLVLQGHTQTIRFQVADQKTHQPIGGAITTATVEYAGGNTIRQFSAPTDALGYSLISWKIERSAPLGSYSVSYSVHQTGYESESNFGNSFSVIAPGISLTNNYDGISSSYAQGPAGSALHLAQGPAGSALHVAQGPAGSALHIERSIPMNQFYN